MVHMASKILFEERKLDIIKYFDFVKFIIDEKPEFRFKNRITNQFMERSIDIEMTHILKANAYVILYNLVEATITNAIEDIHTHLDSEQDLCIDSLIESITKMVMKNVDGNFINKMNFSTGEVAKLVLKTWLDQHKQLVANNKNPLFSGNVDAFKIRNVADLYGFSSQTNTELTKDGCNLLKIKTARNSLAHGSESFLNKGQGTSIDALEEIKEEVFYYLEEILNNIQGYLDGRSYLRPPINAQPQMQV